jgi:glycopeptide antibiotics resistance protein
MGPVEILTYMRSSILRITPVSMLLISALFVSTYIWKHNIRLSSCISYLALVLFTTVILRQPTGAHEVNFKVLWSYRAFMKGYRPDLFCEVVANVIMFIPLGALVASLARKYKIIISIATCTVFVIIIEALQLVFQCGLCEIDDVISGMLGAGIGCFIYQIIEWVSNKIRKDLRMNIQEDI